MKYIIDLPEQITISDGVISMTGNVGWSVIEKAVHKAVPTRHADEQGEGLRERLEGYLFMLGKSGFDSDKEYAKEIRRRCLVPTTPTKTEEPLAVLADRKGMKINTSRPKKEWAIGIRRKGVGTDKKGPVEVFKNPTYALAEAKARAYLEALPDKEAK